MATYWNEQGTHQAIAEALQGLIPAIGEVPDGKTTNKHLERFRRAQNCYYDLYNNGLCNRAREFSTLFRIPGVPREIKQNYGYNFMISSATEEAIDAKMDQFILLAQAEQIGLKKVLTPQSNSVLES
jgi:hypothetical protein